MKPPVLAMSGVGVRRDGGAILADVDWTIEAGQRWVVLGPNGAGKTTVLRIATGYLFPSDGRVELLGRCLGAFDVREERARIGVAGAALDALVAPERTPLELVVTGACGALDPWWDRYAEGDRTRARAGRRARDLIDWISALPGLKVSQPGAVLVGGHPGLRVDLEAVKAPACHDGTPLEKRIGLFLLADQEINLRVPGTARLIVVDVRGTPITFVYQGEDRLFDSVLDPIVESITFPED